MTSIEKTFILDTQCLIWFVEGDRRLSKKHIEYISSQHNMIFVSTASIWEMAIKIQLKKLTLKYSLKHFTKYMDENLGFSRLAINHHHAIELSELPMYHKDPYDRMIIAQAISEGVPVLTADPVFKKYKINLL